LVTPISDVEKFRASGVQTIESAERRFIMRPSHGAWCRQRSGLRIDLARRSAAHRIIARDRCDRRHLSKREVISGEAMASASMAPRHVRSTIEAYGAGA